MKRRLLRKLLLALAVLGTVAALFYAVEDWRGARAWAQTRRQLEARGESLDPATFIPPPVPDDQNFAMAPLFVRALQYRPDPQTGELAAEPHGLGDATLDWIAAIPFGPAKSLNIPRPDNPKAGWREGLRRDLAPWQRYYRARPDFPHAPDAQTPAADVLLALSVYDPILDELALAAQTRPRDRSPVPWRREPAWAISLPHYDVFQKLATALDLRALGRLGHDQPSDALRDVQLILRLRQATAADPTVIASLVSAAMTERALQPVWEGLLDRRWSADELLGLQKRLEAIDFLAEFARAFRGGERAIFLCRSMDELKRGNRMSEFLKLITRGPGEAPNNSPLPGWQAALVPAGWIDQNKAAGCRLYQATILDVFDPAAHRVWVGRARSAPRDFEPGAWPPYNFLVRMVTPVFDSLLMRMAWSQTITDEAATACALERYYLDHRAYPERLGELTPAYCARTPTDVITGAPLNYRTTADGRYRLYSVGWNEQDEDGATAKATESLADGDWVWRYTPGR